MDMGDGDRRGLEDIIVKILYFFSHKNVLENIGNLQSLGYLIINGIK